MKQHAPHICKAILITRKLYPAVDTGGWFTNRTKGLLDKYYNDSLKTLINISPNTTTIPQP